MMMAPLLVMAILTTFMIILPLKSVSTGSPAQPETVTAVPLKTFKFYENENCTGRSFEAPLDWAKGCNPVPTHLDNMVTSVDQSDDCIVLYDDRECKNLLCVTHSHDKKNKWRNDFRTLCPNDLANDAMSSYAKCFVFESGYPKRV